MKNPSQNAIVPSYSKPPLQAAITLPREQPDSSVDHGVPRTGASAAELSSADNVVLIDPKRIRPGKFPNRHKTTFDQDSFEQLRQSILLARKNTVPILVRRILPTDASGIEFEVIYGERRLRACQEAGVQVQVIISSEIDDAGNFFETVRENQCRVDLSPWEIGCQAKFVLETKLCANQTRLASEFGCSKSRISEAIQLASLPPEILNAFDSPNTLQFRHAKRLGDAIKNNPQATLAAAREIAASNETRTTQEVIDLLLQASGDTVRPSNAPIEMPLENNGNCLGMVVFDKNGNVDIRLNESLRVDQRIPFLKHLQRFYARKTQRTLENSSKNHKGAK